MMSTYNCDHPLYSTGLTLSPCFQFLFRNAVLSFRLTSILINLLFKISRIYQESEERVDFTLHYDISCAYPYNNRFGIVTSTFTFMHLKCKQRWLTLNCIRYPALPLVHKGRSMEPPRENLFPTGMF